MPQTRIICIVHHVVTGKFEDFRLVVRNVEAGVPFPVAFVDDVGIELEFNTRVAERADVGESGVEAGSRGLCFVEQHVGGLTRIEIEATREALQEAEVDTDVPSVVLFPRELRVGRRRGCQTRDAVISHRGVGSVLAIAADVVVTVHTVGCAEFQHVDPLDVLHELLVVEVPRSTERPEQTPLVVLSEERRSVVTDGGLQEVAGIEVVVEDSEVGKQRLGRNIVIGSEPVARVEVTRRQMGNLRIQIADALVVVEISVVLGFLTDQGADAVLVKIDILPRCRVRGGQHAILRLVGLQTGIAAGVVAGFEAPVAAAFVEAHLSGVVRLQGQLAERLPLQVDASVELVALLPLVVVFSRGARVGVGVLRNQRVVRSVLVVSPRPWQNRHACESGVGIVERLHRHVLTVGVGHVHASTRLQILVDFVVGVHTCLNTVVLDAVEYTFRVAVRNRVVVSRLGCSALQHCLVFLHLTRAGHVVHPVGLGAAQQLVGTIVRGTACGIVGVLAGIADSVALEFQQLLAGHHTVVVVISQLRHTELGAHRECALAFLTALGGDQNHTVGSTATIDRSCGSVFQHGDALDVVRVEHRNRVRRVREVRVVTAVDGDAIDNVQRTATSVDRTDTANANLRSRARLTRGLRHLHTGELTAEHLIDRNRGDVGNFSGADRGDTTRLGFAALCTIGHNHHFVKRALFVGKHDAHVRTSRHLDRLHADIRDAQQIMSLRTRQSELTVHVSCRTDLCSCDHHGSTYNGFVVLRHYGTTDLRLGHCPYCCE